MGTACGTAVGLSLAGACPAGGAPAAAGPPQPAVPRARAVRMIAAAMVPGARCIEHPPDRYLGFTVTVKTVPGTPDVAYQAESHSRVPAMPVTPSAGMD